MQLKRLYIKDYKILKDFTLEFPSDSEKHISVFIGANGSGKSTILEAIAEIFSCVLLGKTANFGFDFEYKYTQTFIKFPENYRGFIPHPILIKIAAEKGKLPEMYISTNNGDEFADFPKKIAQYSEFIPDAIVIYYSGLSEIMEKLCKPHEDRLSEAYRKGNANIDRGFFYYKPEHFGIILLSLLSFEYGDVPEFLKSKAKIEDIESLQIRLKKPGWHKDSIENFWGAEGEVRKFLDFLNENSATFDDLNNPDSSNRKGNIVIEAWQDEALTITIIGREKLYEIREYLIEERKLFEVFNIMLADGLLDNISFSLVKMTDGKPQVFGILSEGEQQAVIIKGLTEFLSGKNTLFLFDEPDTYLHPEWQRQFIPEIQTTVDNTPGSENYYLIATHSPNIVSGIEKDSLFVLEQGGVKEIPFNSYGKNVESLLIDFFNVDGVRNIYVESLLIEVQNMVKDTQFDSPDFKTKFQELKDILRPTAPEIVNINLEIAKSRKQ